MNERSFSRKLNKEAKERNKMINDALESMVNYSKEIFKKNADLEQCKIDEIKYKTTIKELNDYIEIYKTKNEELEISNKEQEEEILKLRKKMLKNETETSSLKSIFELIIKEYGIDEISDVTKLEKEKLNKLIEEK